jgi:hypothetical protein
MKKRNEKIFMFFLNVYAFIFFFVLALASNEIPQALLWAFFAILVFNGLELLENGIKNRYLEG